jgi:hypothetical protein
MSAPPEAIAPNLHTNLLNVYIQIANKMGCQKMAANEPKKRKRQVSGKQRFGSFTVHPMFRADARTGPLLF